MEERSLCLFSNVESTKRWAVFSEKEAPWTLSTRTEVSSQRFARIGPPQNYRGTHRLEQKWIEISVDTFQMFHMLFRVTLIRQDLHLTTPSCVPQSPMNSSIVGLRISCSHKDGRGHGTLAGADVKIRLEPFKGCKRRVRNIKGTSVFVELNARMKVLSQASFSLIWVPSYFFFYLGWETVTDQSITSGLIDINFTAEMMDPALPPNPKKAVLYRPSVPLLTSVVATICEELPPESVVLLYISASGHFYLTNRLLHKMKETAKSTGIQDRVVNLSSVAHGCPYFTRSITRAGILRSYVAGLYKNVVTPVSELMQRSFSSRLRSLGLWTSLLTPFTGLDKISSLALTDKEILGEGDNTKPEIQIKLDKEKKILSIRDKGVGMIKDLRTIAKSETL
ncbi:hypothetical protein FXO38_29520 [Capsicum annuum]|nr:hypothetical protein FXO38_29520 [Capsicum annuum]KAF3651594.1 hypothetical protein FXO37_17935 [Capsicum annuum]